jgi:hypothetical protein
MAMSAVIDLSKTRARRAGKRAAPISNELAHLSEKPSPDRAAYYAKQAAEVRAKAEVMVNDDVRNVMLRLAAVWNAMAQKAMLETAGVISPPRLLDASGRRGLSVSDG